MTCKRCKRDMRPLNFGQDRVCAFLGKEFDSNNWNCATMNKLRGIVEGGDHIIYGDDESIAVLNIPYSLYGGFLVMTWYKRRGQTGNALIMSTDNVEYKLTLELADELIAHYEKEGEPPYGLSFKETE